jgi:hypothetical protein
MRRDYRSSSLRKTLLSIESGCGAVSKTETAFCRIRSEPGLSKWLCRNALIGIEFTNSPFDRERTVQNSEGLAERSFSGVAAVRTTTNQVRTSPHLRS